MHIKKSCFIQIYQRAATISMKRRFFSRFQCWSLSVFFFHFYALNQHLRGFCAFNVSGCIHENIINIDKNLHLLPIKSDLHPLFMVKCVKCFGRPTIMIDLLKPKIKLLIKNINNVKWILQRLLSKRSTLIVRLLSSHQYKNELIVNL